MEQVTVGVDAPRAWGMWSEAGPVAWHEEPGRVVEARRDSARALRRALVRRSIEAATVEIPHGGDDAADRLKSLLMASEGSGWWLASIESTLHVEPRRALASEWRKELGFPPGLKREQLKDLAVRLVAKITAELDLPPVVGPLGGVQVDACEAICIAMVTWKWRYGITGVLRTWKDTGSFGGKRDPGQTKASTDG